MEGRPAYVSKSSTRQQWPAYLGGIDFALNDIKNGDVAPFLGAGGDHDVFRLGQPSHHV